MGTKKTWEDRYQARFDQHKVKPALRKKYQDSFKDRAEFKANVIYERIHHCLGRIPKSCCDIGCGFGVVATRFAREGIETLGIDHDDDLIEICRLKQEEEGLPGNLCYQSFDISKTLPEKKFDLILCIDTLEHIQDDASALHNMVSSLQENGAIYISTPNKFCLFSLLSDPHFHVPLVSLMPRRWTELIVSKLLRKIYAVDVEKLYSLSSLRQLCNRAHLKIRHINLEQFRETVITQPTPFRKMLNALCRINFLKSVLENIYIRLIVREHCFLLQR
ncbi:MAG: methyltransferase domain-containing protein [Candidatus Omnitrophica bacterium]|nr:methyltransferase domain-containing protein [Candidatus Omnitrophota bacterium]